MSHVFCERFSQTIFLSASDEWVHTFFKSDQAVEYFIIFLRKDLGVRFTLLTLNVKQWERLFVYCQEGTTPKPHFPLLLGMGGGLDPMHISDSDFTAFKCDSVLPQIGPQILAIFWPKSARFCDPKVTQVMINQVRKTMFWVETTCWYLICHRYYFIIQ